MRAVVSSRGGAVLPSDAGRALGALEKAWEWKPDREETRERSTGWLGDAAGCSP